MPDVRNCRRCGRIFNYLGGVPICPACKEVDEEEFRRIKEYLYDNPGASLQQVSTELHISVEKIKMFLKEGRLEIIGDNPNLFLECEKCGKSIRSGRFCTECEKEIASKLDSAAKDLSSSISESSPRRDHFRYRHK